MITLSVNLTIHVDNTAVISRAENEKFYVTISKLFRRAA